MKLLLIVMSIICLPFMAKAQDLSNKGKDFWIGYGNHVRMFNGGAQLEAMQLYITSDVNTTGTVTIASIGFSQSFTITANQITTIDIPRSAALMDHGIYDHGIHLTAAKPVVVYSFIYVNAQSGATVCLPTNTLGKEYYSVNFSQISNEVNSASYFFVVAADTGTTTVEITPSATTKGGQPAGVPFLVTLKQGQIYQVLGTTTNTTGVDLTGSKIRSINTGSGCKRIGVYCGSGKIAIGCNGPGSSDNLYQQMYPTSTWGKKYITLPGMVNSFNYFRIAKSDPSAIVTLNGNVISSGQFINNFYYQFINNQPNVIESDKPILVAQYFTTQGCGGNGAPGDPEMIYLNPVEQTINSVTLNSMQPNTGTNITQHYLNVVLKNDAAAISSFRVDGSPFNNFIQVPNDNGFVYARIPTTKGTHNITCDTGFNIIAYGLGNAESYGYSGGTNLKDLYQFASVKNQYATVAFPATCTDAPFEFSMTFPYQPLRIEWKFNGLFPDEVIAAPVADSTWFVNGKQLYRYKIPKTYKGPPVGVYPIKIFAENPTVDGCKGLQEIDYDLNVFQKPLASFDISGTQCFDDAVKFINTVSNLDRPVIKWLWDMGAGDTSMRKELIYQYKNTGTYTATMRFITDIGCISNTEQKEIVIHPNPVADFDIKSPFCINRDVFLNDKSIIKDGAISKWTWSMGNNDTLRRTDGIAFPYQYKVTGKYKVALQLTSDKGCLSNIFNKDIEVHHNPVAGFSMPGSCILDPFSQFQDTSKIADGSQSGFTYSWNFGDPLATPANPNQQFIKNPKHKFNATGNYDVSLLVTSNNGCQDSVKQVFTINGASPQSVFSIAAGNEHCSNDSIYLKDQSTVDFGNIVKLEIYWDDTNNPSNKQVIDLPEKTGTYVIKYPEFFTPASQNRSIKLIAYSGENCLNTSTKAIQIKATPELRFDSIPPVCADVPAFMITQAAVLNGLQGNVNFSGPGLKANGMFTPKDAKQGTHTLRYTFNATNGCSNFAERKIVVHPLPIVNAGPDLFVLEESSVELQGSGSSNILSYLWSPSTALNKVDTSRPLASPRDDMYYRLTATTSFGCTSSDEVLVKVLKKPVIPNTFSPNGDGIHDQWVIKYLENYPDATIEIFNRYGQPVIKLGNYRPWDGTFNGKPVPVGTYYYIINPKNGRKQMTGFVDIIR
jgi:gliding motility-associated-like protein